MIPLLEEIAADSGEHPLQGMALPQRIWMPRNPGREAGVITLTESQKSHMNSPSTHKGFWVEDLLSFQLTLLLFLCLDSTALELWHKTAQGNSGMVTRASLTPPHYSA